MADSSRPTLSNSVVTCFLISLFVNEASEIVDFSVTRVRQDQLQQVSLGDQLIQLIIWPL